MKRSKGLSLALVVGLLIAALVIFNGCLAPTTTTPDGEATQAGWFEQYGMIIFLVLLFAMFYFLMIRPQRKKQKEQRELMGGLQKGDKVITVGGVYGAIERSEERR